MYTVLMASFSVVFYSAYALLVSRAAGKIDPFLSSGLVNLIGTVLPLTVWLLFKGRNSGLPDLASPGIVLSVLAGLCIAAFGVFVMKAFESGAASYVIPLVYGGTIAVSAAVGWGLFREEISPTQTAGIVLILCGLGVVIYARAKGV
ncbi:MAG TPA: EamA family transporter [Alphaproteobacteria bacterium]|nr:EamA family transporter [Alphaproteobacteria bacterium]